MKKYQHCPCTKMTHRYLKKKKCACDGKVGIDIMKARLKEVKGRTTKSKT